MSDKELRFINELRLCTNRTEAARRAGYKHPGVAAAKLMKKPHIIKAVADATAPLAKKYEIGAETVIEQLAFVLTREASDFIGPDEKPIPVHQMSRRAQACIDGFKVKVKTYRDEEGNVTGEDVETEIKLASKNAAIEMGLKHKGLFPTEQLQPQVQINLAAVIPGLLKEVEKGRNIIDAETVSQRAVE
jgi:phage terminase small subunit